MADAGNDLYTRRQMLRRVAGAAAGALAMQAIPPINAGEKQPMDTDSLLAHVQRRTLGYFTDFAHPDSGMIRERSNNSSAYGKDVVATGATGFGIMSIIAGQSNGWVTHDDALKQIRKMVGFLEKCDHFHGVFPHFMDGSTGKTIPFSKYVSVV
jgi:hypothetical protein